MLQLRNILGLAWLLCLSAALHAQTTVTTSGGTTNTIPVYTGSSTLGNSPISISGTNVGIGTSNPQVGLDVEVAPSEPSRPGFLVSDGSGIANLGTTPVAQIYMGQGATHNVLDLVAGANNYTGTFGYWYTNTTATTAFNFLKMASGANGVVFNVDGTGGVYASGNVGIGTSSPGAKLEVRGNIKLSSDAGASMTYSDGSVQSTAWTGVLSGGDYAESVNVSGDRERYEPGDVLVVDPASEGQFLKSSTPYASTVTGIYSTKPGVTGRRQHTPAEHMKEEVPMAMTGIVPTKVCAENGPIKVGDLLVTSSRPGFAMKGTDRGQMLGAVIGKAIGHLDTGTGVIEVVVTLQ